MTTPTNSNPHRTSVGQLKNGDQVSGYVRIPPEAGKGHLVPILAIDPGTEQSAWIVWDGQRVLDCGIERNIAVLHRLRHAHTDADPWMPSPKLMAFEMVASYGMAVGAETFHTVLWTGRFVEAWEGATNEHAWQVYRKDVKLHLCQSMRAKDGNIRQALIDRFGEVGTKKTPGPLYGVKSHIWAALAVAVTAWDELRRVH